MNVFATTNMVGSVVERRFYGGHDRKVCSSTRGIVSSLDKTLHDAYLCLVEMGRSNKTFDKTPVTPKRVRIHPTYSTIVAFPWKKDKDWTNQSIRIGNAIAGA